MSATLRQTCCGGAAALLTGEGRFSGAEPMLLDDGADPGGQAALQARDAALADGSAALHARQASHAAASTSGGALPRRSADLPHHRGCAGHSHRLLRQHAQVLRQLRRRAAHHQKVRLSRLCGILASSSAVNTVSVCHLL